MNSEIIAKLEALLFYYGDAISIKKISSILGVNEKEAGEAAEVLRIKLQENEERGLLLLRRDDEIQLVTKPAFGSILQKIVEDDLKEDLTPAALETLSIIAYLGPLSRAQIDYIRGVNSSFTLRSLLLRGLIVRNDSKKKGGFYDYEVSFDFWKHVGLESAEQLPEYEKYRQVLGKLERANTSHQ